MDNSAAPVNAQVKVVGARNNFGAGGEDAVTETGGSVFVPQSAETFTYDDDGNLTSDGRWNYTWDGENRLVSMEAIAAVPVAARRRLEFAYDWMGRRIQKKPYVWNPVTGSYKLESPISFVYDGWNVMAEYVGLDIPTKSFIWGQDLSGGLQGAGGIGGLLFIQDSGISYSAGYDGNGNLSSLVKASDGSISASYEYDPFGNTLKSIGDYAAENRFRFSTKYADTETALIYYGYRYYNPQTGRWLSRDPIGEQGGTNLNVFVKNDPVSFIDPLGLFDIDVHYYLTYYLARKTGCFPDWFSREIAEGNLRSDLDKEKRPGSGLKVGVGPGVGQVPIGPLGVGVVPDWRQQQANIDFHAFGTHQQNAKRANELYRDAVRSGDAFKLGTYLHFLQDEFSHYPYAGNPVTGQAETGFAVDHTTFKPEWSMEMARATWEKLKQFAKNRGCRCTGEMTEKDWKTVREFVDVGYDPKTDGGKWDLLTGGVSDDQLRRKVDILGIKAVRSPTLR